MKGGKSAVITALTAVLLVISVVLFAVRISGNRRRKAAVAELVAETEALRAELESGIETREGLRSEAERLEEEKEEEKDQLELWMQKSRELEEIIGS